MCHAAAARSAAPIRSSHVILNHTAIVRGRPKHALDLHVVIVCAVYYTTKKCMYARYAALHNH